MSIQTELSRIINAKAAIKAAIEGKGVTVPDATLLDGMAALIESIQAGGAGDKLEVFTLTPTENVYFNTYDTFTIGETGITTLKFGAVFGDANNTDSYQDFIVYFGFNSDLIDIGGSVYKKNSSKGSYLKYFNYSIAAGLSYCHGLYIDGNNLIFKKKNDNYKAFFLAGNTYYIVAVGE